MLKDMLGLSRVMQSETEWVDLTMCVFYDAFFREGGREKKGWEQQSEQEHPPKKTDKHRPNRGFRNVESWHFLWCFASAATGWGITSPNSFYESLPETIDNMFQQKMVKIVPAMWRICCGGKYLSHQKKRHDNHIFNKSKVKELFQTIGFPGKIFPKLWRWTSFFKNWSLEPHRNNFHILSLPVLFQL